MATILIANITKYFQREDRQHMLVLDKISVTVEHGKITCLLGPSGCGKSTLLNIIAGLEKADEGKIEIVGNKEENGQRQNISIGYVFQDPRLLNWRSVANNIKFALKGVQVNRSEWDARVERYLRLVGLWEFKDQYPLYLSGGMRQRVGLVRALAIEPDVLLMDEPFSGLDEITARKLREELLSVCTKLQQTVLFVTHNAREAAFLGDQIVFMAPRPARVKTVTDNPIPLPRQWDDVELMKFESHISHELWRIVQEAS